jgi:hypothetical protein
MGIEQVVEDRDLPPFPRGVHRYPERWVKMDILSKEQLNVLTQYRAGTCVSLYMPVYRVGSEKKQNQIRFRNLVRKARQGLIAKGLTARQADDLFSLVMPLVDDDPFWSFVHSEGFCSFMSGRDLFYFRLPVRFEEKVTLMGRFHVKPLLGLVYNDSRFFMLTLGLNGARLFECSRYGMKDLVMEKVPGSFEEVMQYSEPQKGLQLHAQTLAAGTRRAAMFHGHGGGADGKKVNILEYFKMVDRGVTGVIGQERVPLLFAGLDHFFGIYKKANSYPFLTGGNMAVNPEDLTDAELHERAAKMMDAHFLGARNQAVETYLDLAGTGRTAGDIESILPEAYGGRVDSLLLSPDVSKWGTFDPVTLKADVHERPVGDDEDLFDLACVYTHLKGGAVYDIAAGTVPGIPPAAAIFRY